MSEEEIKYAEWKGLLLVPISKKELIGERLLLLQEGMATAGFISTIARVIEDKGIEVEHIDKIEVMLMIKMKKSQKTR